MFLATVMSVKPPLPLGGVCGRCGGVFPVRLIEPFREGFALCFGGGGVARGRVLLSLDSASSQSDAKYLTENAEH